MTQIIKIDPNNFELGDLLPAAYALKNGGTCVFPTETVYGLGAGAFFDDSVKKIFEAKGRPSDNPLIVHIADMEDVYSLCSEVPEKAERLMKRFWGGPLTIIMKRNPMIPDSVTAGLDTVGIRLPSHPVASTLIRLCGFAIAAPSANISGKPSITSGKYAIEELDGKVDVIISGGDCNYGIESTVIDMTCEPPVILRPGAITQNEIINEIGMVELGGYSDKPKCPGMKYTHYAPDAPLYVIEGRRDNLASRINKISGGNFEQTGVLGYDLDMKDLRTPYKLFAGNNVKEYAASLFYNLREFNRMGVSKIYAVPPEKGGLGDAVLNRLYKAAGGKTITFKNILFVCTGNTCRSPMAAAILAKEKPWYNVFSRGINVLAPSPASAEAVEVMNEMGLDISSHRSEQLTRDDLMRADIIFTMTENHNHLILRRYPEFTGRVFTLSPGNDIVDPFGRDIFAYRACARQIERLIKEQNI